MYSPFIRDWVFYLFNNIAPGLCMVSTLCRWTYNHVFSTFYYKQPQNYTISRSCRQIHVLVILVTHAALTNCYGYCKIHISGSTLHLWGHLYLQVFSCLDFEVYNYFINIYGYVFGYMQRDLLLMYQLWHWHGWPIMQQHLSQWIHTLDSCCHSLPTITHLTLTNPPSTIQISLQLSGEPHLRFPMSAHQLKN